MLSQFGVHQFLASVSQFLVALIVIRYQSESVWGEVVVFLLVLNLLSMLLAWGSNSYLLRTISESPATLAMVWQNNLVTRSTLLGATLVGLSIYYWQEPILIWLLVWLLGSFMVNSFNVIILYTRKFLIAILVEIISISSILSMIFVQRFEITALKVIQVYAFISILKAVLYLFFFQKEILKNHYWRFNKQIFIDAFPYFIPGFIGFLQTQIDLYSVAYFLPKKFLGEYQIFIKALTMIFILSRILTRPFIKNIYRLKDSSINKFHYFIFKIGLAVSFPAIIAIYILMEYIYNIQLSTSFYLLGYLLVIPFFGYIIKTHQLLKYHEQYKIVRVFLMSTIVNLGLNIILIPRYGMLGALCGTVVIQWFVFVLFNYYASKTVKRLAP